MSEERVLSDVVWTPERGSADQPEVRSMYWNNLLFGDDGFNGRTQTSADIRITPDTALQSTVVLAACRILAESIASMPLHVYRRTKDGYREIASDVPLYKVLSFAPNEWQTKFEFFEQMVMNLTLWGNSYSRIRSGRYGAVSALDNFHPSNMEVERLENGRLRYSYMNPETGRVERYSQDDIMHVRWTPEPNGIKGMVPVEIAREAIALARACEIHAGRFWANSARPGIVLQTDSSLSPEAAERLRDNWERIHRGVDRASRTAILTNGLRVEQVGFNAEQSQYESTRRFQSEEIARVYRLPLSLIQGQSSGSIEENGQEFVTYTLVPWLRRIESAISRSLIYNDDVFFAEFDTKGLMRGNSNARAGFYSTMINLGLMTHNECRRAENLPPIGEIGDHHLVAMNLQPLEAATKPKEPPPGMPGMPGPPPEAAGGVPSLPGVKTGKTPTESEQGEASEKKPDEPLVEYAEGKFGRVKHVMEEGTLDLKSGEKIEVEPGKPVALVVDEETGEEVGVEASKLKPVEEKPAVEEKRGLTPQSEALYKSQEEIARKHGRWKQADAHYVPRSPFATKGMVCRNCVYYEDGGACEIVKGGINPDGICKLWVIPSEKLVETRSPEEEARSADCGRDEGGRFGSGNKCQEDGSGGGGSGGGMSSPAGGEPDKVYGSVSPDVKLPPPVRTIDAEALLEQISKNPNGFTLDPYSAESPSDGIMVSEFKNDSRRSVKLSAKDIVTKEGRDSFANWLKSNSDVLQGFEGERFVGGWRAGDDFYIDISTRFSPEEAERALEVGRDSGQLAVFNLGTLKETWVQYDSGDDRKPPEWDRAFARARKDAQVDQVYGDAPDLQDEDIAADLSKHGKKTVRAYNLAEETENGTAAAVRRAGEEEEPVGDVPRDADVLREGRGEPRQDSRSVVVRGRAGPDAATVRGSDAARRLIENAEAAYRAAFGSTPFPRVEFRDIGDAYAYYSPEDDTLYVSPDAGEPDDSDGWTSSGNPLLHEACHRIHRTSDADSYRDSESVTFTPEQRELIEAEVSRYAAVNAREFIAEYIAGQLSGKIYSPDITAIARSIWR
jgi:HK97 family phage portal protein